MADASLFSDREQALLEALSEAGVEFMVVGMAAASLHGVPAVTEDINLWFSDLSDPQLLVALKRVGATYVAPSVSNPPLLVGGSAELFDVVTHMHGLESFEKERARSSAVSLGRVEVQVLSLERIIASKRASNRPKDRAILPVLEDALRLKRSRERRD
ncbi:hypothetical protein ABI59_19725 [Acidobacteria bacterium Mor1]|nr:hypothetical protein ABI59_19725 [Acidobacteria bacterium Mor1]